MDESFDEERLCENCGELIEPEVKPRRPWYKDLPPYYCKACNRKRFGHGLKSKKSPPNKDV